MCASSCNYVCRRQCGEVCLLLCSSESLLPLVPPIPICELGLSLETVSYPEMRTGSALFNPFSPSQTHCIYCVIIQCLSVFNVVAALLFEGMIGLFLDSRAQS